MSKKLNKRNIRFIISVLLLIGLLSGCNRVTNEPKEEGSTVAKQAIVTNITPEQAKERLDIEKNIILLDVRTKGEYDSGYIKDSMLIPVDNLKEEAESKLKDKDTPVFVYCRSGNRSTTAAKILVDLGYKNVYNLGGINKWPYDIEK